MKSKTWAWILGIFLILCLCASVPLMLPGEQAVAAEVWSDGEKIATLELSVDSVQKVQSNHGVNVITVKDGKIAVTEADCPDHYCMDRGYCSGGTHIVCLPNRLVIQFVGKQEIDGVAG